MDRGYMGKLLFVDLTTGKIHEETPDESLYHDFIGGYGLAARLLYSRQRGGIDPLGPDNTLCFLSGPLTGTPAISGTRFTVAAKSPLTGGWGDANSGGSFGAFLKFSGYDGVFFTGAAERPVYLLLDNGRAELRDAVHLWGKDTYETDDALKAELGKDTAIACIGPAGEKLGLISCIMHNKGSAAARSGLGAVMGSKKLKAVAARGKLPVPMADEKKVRQLRAKYLTKLGGHIDWIKKFGTTFVIVRAAESGDSPVKNWSGIGVIDFPNPQTLSADAFDKHKLSKHACYRCPVGCEALMKEGKGEYEYSAGSFRPEYETVAMLGTNCLNNNIDAIIKANDVCNRYGIDTISAGAVIAFAIECFERGTITGADTGGIELTWGNHRAVVAMTEQMGRKEGFGGILIDGVKSSAEKIGGDTADFAIHIGGQEVPGHSPLAGFHWPATYIANATPGRHTQGSEGFSQELMPKYDKGSFAGRGMAHKIGTCHQHIVMCTGMCLFVTGALPGAQVLTDFIEAVTGWHRTTEDLLKAGERIENMRMAFNIREGLDPMKLKVPPRIIGNPPHKEGPVAGITVDADILVREYLEAMGWDMKAARPGKGKLLELGLDDVAEAIWPAAI